MVEREYLDHFERLLELEDVLFELYPMSLWLGSTVLGNAFRDGIITESEFNELTMLRQSLERI